MIKIKELPEAFKSAVSESELKKEVGLLKLAQATETNRILNLMVKSDKELADRIKELEKPKSALEYNPVPRTDTGIEPKKEEVKEPSFWSDLAQLVKKYRK